MESLKKTSRSRKLCVSDVKKLCIAIRTHCQQSLLEIASQVKVCCNTTLLYLHELGLKNCIALRKPHLSDEYREERLAFARAHRHWTCKDWYNVIWTNKSSFEIGKNLQQIRVWCTLDNGSCAYEGWCSIVANFKHIGQWLMASKNWFGLAHKLM